jgi:hypothetical protein
VSKIDAMTMVRVESVEGRLFALTDREQDDLMLAALEQWRYGRIDGGAHALHCYVEKCLDLIEQD